MKKVYEHIDFARVGHFQSILESDGIKTMIKNLGASVGIGEIPFTEVFPELWVVNDEDYERAMAALESYTPPETEDTTDWTCPSCGEYVEKQFGECWNCSEPRPHEKGRKKPPELPDSAS